MKKRMEVAMQRRRVLITLPGPDYRRLAEMAEREERAVDQQASYVLRRVLAPPEPAREVADASA